MNKYGGAESFSEMFRNEKGFTEDIFLDDDFQENDSTIYSKENIIYCFNALKDIFEICINKWFAL